jgi:hypothetical protein
MRTLAVCALLALPSTAFAQGPLELWFRQKVVLLFSLRAAA